MFRPQNWIHTQSITPIGDLQAPEIEDLASILRILMFFMFSEQLCCTHYILAAELRVGGAGKDAGDL